MVHDLPLRIGLLKTPPARAACALRARASACRHACAVRCVRRDAWRGHLGVDERAEELALYDGPLDGTDARVGRHLG